MYLDFNHVDDVDSDSEDENSFDASNTEEADDTEQNIRAKLYTPEIKVGLVPVLNMTSASVHNINTCGSSGVNSKYKQKIRHLKDLYSRTNSQLQDKVEENRTLAIACEKNRAGLASLTNDIEQEVLARKSLERENESLHLQCVRLKSDLSQSRRSLDEAKASLRKACREREKLEDRYQNDIANAHANSLKEVKGILDQYPKVVNENKVLKEKIRRIEDEIESLRRKSGCKRKLDTDTQMPSNDTKRFSDAKKAVKVASQLFHSMSNESHRSAHQSTFHQNKIEKIEEAVSVNRNIITSHAARIYRACNVRSIGPLTERTDLLNGADRQQKISRKESYQPPMSWFP